MTNDSKGFKKPYYEKDVAGPGMAVPEFMAHDLFKDLIPEPADPMLLEHLARHTAAAWSSGNLDEWRRRVMTAFDLLKRVPSKDTAKLDEIIELTVQAYYGPQKAAFFTAKDRQDKAKAPEPEQRFPALFQEYQNSLENLFRHIATIFAFAKDAAFGHMQTVKSAPWWLGQSAKAKAEKLNSPMILGELPLNTLTEGYDRHFRNAIAHVRYRFLDDDTVEMWDTNENGKETWRETLTYEECEHRHQKIAETVRVMESAYFLYEMNTGHLPSTAIGDSAKQQSTEERHNLIYMLAKRRYNLEVVGLEDDEAALRITAKIIPNFALAQTSKVYVGGDSWARSYDIEQTVDSVPLKRVAFGYIRALRKNIGELPEVTLTVQDDKGADAGRLVVQHDHVEFLNTANESKVPVEVLPCVENTLRAIDLRFTRRGAPRPSRPAPSRIVLPPPKRIVIPK